MKRFLFLLVFWGGVNPLWALPLGHEAGLLGNTTSRPGDVGAALFFPSNLAKMTEDKTQLYSGLIVYGARAESGDGKTELPTKFVPYFTASNFEIGKAKIVTFGYYENDFLRSSSAATDNVTMDSTSEQQSSQFELGMGVAYALNDHWALGWKTSLVLFNETFNLWSVAEFNNQQILSTWQMDSEFYNLQNTISLSYFLDENTFSLSVHAPRIPLSKSVKFRFYSLAAANGETASVVNLEGEPKYASSWGVGAGWSLNRFRLRPTVEYFHFVNTGENTTVAGFDTILHVSEQDRFKVKTGLEMSFSTWSLLTGTTYWEKIYDVNKFRERITIRSGSFGVKIKQSPSQPVIGVYFSENRAGSQKTNLLGLLYSTHYSF